MKISFLAIAGAFLLPVLAESPHSLDTLVQHPTTSDSSVSTVAIYYYKARFKQLTSLNQTDRLRGQCGFDSIPS